MDNATLAYPHATKHRRAVLRYDYHRIRQGRSIRRATIAAHCQRWCYFDITKARGHKVDPHGLRKNAVNTLLEVGCTVAEVSSITGQSLQMVEHYARERDNRKLAKRAMARWENNA